MTEPETIHARAHVIFRRQASDGQYGSETIEVSLDVPLDGPYALSEEQVIVATLATARQLVHEELHRSPSRSVRQAVEYPKPALPVTPGAHEPDDLPYDDDDPEAT